MLFQSMTDLRQAYDAFLDIAAENNYQVGAVPPILAVVDRSITIARAGGVQEKSFFGVAPTSDLDGWMKLDLSAGLPPELGLGIVGFDMFLDTLDVDPADTSDLSDVLEALSKAEVLLKINGNIAGRCRGRDCLVGDVSSRISAGDTSSFVRGGLEAGTTPFMLPRPYLVGPTQKVQLLLKVDAAIFSGVAADPLVFGRLHTFIASKTSF